MASTEKPDLRSEIGAEREKLNEAIATLRAEIAHATDVRAQVREHKPLVAAGVLGLGFVAFAGVVKARLLLTRPQPKRRGRLSLKR